MSIFNPPDAGANIEELLNQYLKKTLAASLYVSKLTPIFTSAVSITNATQSTSTTTGALVVAGGVGISKALNVGEQIKTTVAQNPTIGTVDSGALRISQGGGSFLTDVQSTTGGFYAGRTGVSGIPAYTFTSDNTTGLALSSVGTLRLRAGGVNTITSTDSNITVAAPIQITSASALAIYGNGGIELDQDITTTGGNLEATTGRLYAGTSTTSNCAFSWVGNTDMGLHRSSANVLNLMTGGSARLTVNSSGTLCTGRLSVNSTSLGSNECNIYSNSASLASALVVVNSNTGTGAHVRHVVQSSNGAAIPYLALDNSVSGYTISNVGGTLSIGSGSTDTGAKTYGIRANSSNVVDLLTSCRLNSITMHNVAYSSSLNGLRGVSPIVITSQPIGVEYQITRVGRTCTLTIKPSINFTTTIGGAGRTFEYDLYGILVNHGMTINSLPSAASVGTYLGECYMPNCSLIRNGGSRESSVACYISPTNGLFVNIRLYVQTSSDIVAAANNYMLGLSVSWVARADAI